MIMSFCVLISGKSSVAIIAPLAIVLQQFAFIPVRYFSHGSARCCPGRLKLFSRLWKVWRAYAIYAMRSRSRWNTVQHLNGVCNINYSTTHFAIRSSWSDRVLWVVTLHLFLFFWSHFYLYYFYYYYHYYYYYCC
jgi:hypothetical protein